jgi:CheY-like chemotaxis protein
MGQIIERTFPKNIQVRISCAKESRAILGDATQLHQVLLNLCVNARDAMPNGGILTLEAQDIEIDATYASAIPEATPGAYAVWWIKDTGMGIPPDLLERIFEPFFTTKGPDKGTGLGLSTVIGIVKSHGGFVRVYSMPGQGTTFAVYLPASDSRNGHASSKVKVKTTFRGHGETILVVDDEPAVRQVARAVLTELNFQVITASSGTEALIQVAEKRSELSAVITDLHMPQMDGLTFVRAMRTLLPTTGIIVASGRVAEHEATEFRMLGARLLDKPFTQELLIKALEAVLQK